MVNFIDASQEQDLQVYLEGEGLSNAGRLGQEVYVCEYILNLVSCIFRPQNLDVVGLLSDMCVSYMNDSNDGSSHELARDLAVYG